MSEIKVILLALAGICYICAAIVRWRGLARDQQAPRPIALLLGGLLAHVLATAMSFAVGGGGDFTFAALGSLLAALAMLVGTRFLSVHSPGLLLLPVGIMAVLVALFALVDSSRFGREADQRSLVFYVHIIFMSANLAAGLLASAAAGMFLVVSRQLKAASQRALRLPQLPPLAILCQRSLLLALAMLVGGMVSGAVAIDPESGFTALHPTVLLAVVTMIVIAILLFVHASERISHRSLCWGAMLTLILEALIVVSVMAVPAHG